MEKQINLENIDYESSFVALANYSTSGDDKKVIFRGNSIQIVKVEEDSNSHPVSDLQSVLVRVVKEASERIKANKLSVEIQEGLGAGLLRLGQVLHNEGISQLAQQIFIGDDFVVVDSTSDQTSETSGAIVDRKVQAPYQLSALKLLGAVRYGFQSLGRLVGVTPRPPLVPFDLPGLLPEIRKAHIYKHMSIKELLLLRATSSTLRKEVDTTPESSTRISILQVITEAKRFFQKVHKVGFPFQYFLCRIAQLQAVIGDRTGSEETFKELYACIKDLHTSGYYESGEEPSMLLEAFQKDVIVGKMTLGILIEKFNAERPAAQEAYRLIGFAEAQIALNETDEANKTLIRAERMVREKNPVNRKDLQQIARLQERLRKHPEGCEELSKESRRETLLIAEEMARKFPPSTTSTHYDDRLSKFQLEVVQQQLVKNHIEEAQDVAKLIRSDFSRIMAHLDIALAIAKRQKLTS